MIDGLVVPDANPCLCSFPSSLTRSGGSLLIAAWDALILCAVPVPGGFASLNSRTVAISSKNGDRGHFPPDAGRLPTNKEPGPLRAVGICHHRACD